MVPNLKDLTTEEIARKVMGGGLELGELPTAVRVKVQVAIRRLAAADVVQKAEEEKAAKKEAAKEKAKKKKGKK